MSSKILIVDDDPAARRILVLALQATAEVIEAASGEEAMRLIESQRPRLMLLDMTMPGMGGLEVLAAAQNSAAPMTIIMLTGVTDIDQAKRALDLGAVEFITKPFDVAHLKEKVTRCMEAVPRKARSENGAPWRIESQAPA